LSDTSPGRLELSLSLMMGGDTAETEMNVIFRHEGRRVRFLAGEQLSCNGLAVPGYGTNFHLKAPSDIFSGKLMTCLSTSGRTSASFTFTAPLAPAILSPEEHAQVARSARTPVSYRLSPDQAFHVVALAPPKKAWTPTAAFQPNPVLLDTSAFPSGPGSIVIHQFFTLPDLRGPDFQSVRLQGGSAGYTLHVTWI
jgi:hypothetical protein